MVYASEARSVSVHLVFDRVRILMQRLTSGATETKTAGMYDALRLLILHFVNICKHTHIKMNYLKTYIIPVFFSYII